MTIDNYNPSTALTSYYPSRATNRPARHWATEKLLHDMAGIGLLSFFEGPGPNPMALSGASTSKIWLDTDIGVTSASGAAKRYSGTGSPTDEANWLPVTPGAYLLHLGALSPVTSVEDYASRSAAQAAIISGGTLYLRLAGYTTAGDGGAALYKKVGTQPVHAGKFQSADGAWWEIAEPTVNVRQFGAVGNAIADDTAALNGALSLGVAVYVPPGLYRTTAPIVLDNEGLAFYGSPGGNDTLILGDHTAGPVVDVRRRQAVVTDMIISGSATRKLAAATSNNHGLRIASADGSGVRTACWFDRLIVIRQPANGIHCTGEAVSTCFQQVQSLFNNGHGWFFDDGTYDALPTKKRPGIVNLIACRAVDNGGNAVRLSGNGGQSCYRFLLQNLEAYNNAWNSDLPAYSNAQVQGLVQGWRIVDSAFGDPGFANTTMENGDTRLAKVAASASVALASNSTNFFMENSRHIGTTRSLTAFNNIEGIYVNDGYSSSVQSTGYVIGTGCTGVHIRLADPSFYSIPVDAESTGGRLILGDQERVLIAGSSNTFALGAMTAGTMVSSTINALSSVVDIKGEGDTTDSLSVITFSGGGVHHPDGTIVTLVNRNAYTITIVHGTGIKTRTGADVALTQDRSASFVIIDAVAYQI